MAEGKQTVASAFQKIEDHEELCAERYKNIHGRINDVKKSVDGARNAAWTVAIGLAAWFALQVYDDLKHPQPVAPAQAVIQAPAK